MIRRIISIFFHSSPMKRKGTGHAKKPALKRQKSSKVQYTTSYDTRKLASIGAELKYNDLTLNVDANSTSVEVPLTTIGTGTTALLRTGLKVLVKSVEYRVRMTNSALTQANVVRFALVLDKLAQTEQCTWGTGAAVGEVFDAATVVARRNILSSSRFVVLAEDTFTINADSGTGGAPSQCQFHRYVKIPEKYRLVTWSGSSATIPVSNALTLMYLGSTAAGATDVNIEGTARVRFNV